MVNKGTIKNINVTDILGKILVGLIIAFVILVIIMIVTSNPETREKTKVNNELKTEQMLVLLKCAQFHLDKSVNLEINSITDDNMIRFATDYLNLLNNQTNTEIESAQKVKRADLENMVRHIFDKTINYSNVTLEIDDEYVSVPATLVGTDAEIYKFKKREYDESQNVYTVYIDCLEIGPSQFSEIFEGEVTEYNPNDVIKTMIFKYMEKEDRRVLLSYNSIYNT